MTNNLCLSCCNVVDEILRVTSEYLWPYKEDVTRFDFEVDAEDEHMLKWAESLPVTNGHR